MESNDTKSEGDLVPGAMASLALGGFAVSQPGRYITTAVLFAFQPAECLLHSANEKNSNFMQLNRPQPPKMLAHRNLTCL